MSYTPPPPNPPYSNVQPGQLPPDVQVDWSIQKTQEELAAIAAHEAAVAAANQAGWSSQGR